MSVDPYAAKADQYFKSMRPDMVGYIPADVKDVLDVGCGGGGFAAEVKKTRQVRFTGIEPFENAAAAAATRLDEVLQTSAEDGLGRLRGRAFDCIVFNDVLEHLVDPESVLVNAAELLRPGGVVVASIPNMRFLPVLKSLVMRAEWRYTSEGVLDRTHLRFFTHKSIAEMFVASGYRVRTLEGINPCPTSWKFRALNMVTSNAFADTRYLQFAIVATKADPTERNKRPTT